MQMDLWRSTAAVSQALHMGMPPVTIAEARASADAQLLADASMLASHFQVEGIRRWNKGVDYVFRPVIQELAKRGL